MKVIKVRTEMMSYWIKVGLKFDESELIKHRKRHTETQKRR